MLFGAIPMARLVRGCYALCDAVRQLAYVGVRSWSQLAGWGAAQSRALPITATIGLCGFFVAAAACFLILVRGPVYNGTVDDPAVLAFPAIAALTVGLAAWIGARRMAMSLPPRWRWSAAVGSVVSACAMAALLYARFDR